MRGNESAARDIYRDGFETERDASDFLRAIFDRNKFHYATEWPTGYGRIDFVLRNETGKPVLGIECKPRLTGSSNLREFTDAFEQAVAYANALQVPVLLAPILVDCANPLTVCHGGHQIAAYKTISIFAGRVNVGGMFFDPRGRWSMALRGVAVATHREDSFKPDALRFVESTNSKKLRSAR